MITYLPYLVTKALLILGKLVSEAQLRSNSDTFTWKIRKNFFYFHEYGLKLTQNKFNS